ncbi:hypothetical protein [Actimicrobium sp. CCI2.3]|uniref:hypothetical protein n=1 Tax=Actimicrobium sp. CCI2.3 TaxID=3048616 RepID=UPI002AB57069|nr:hypothetical protein [Actimicrobium sp. CCI2.3]MDY7573186.1 hypothetical protein [Actimicrobium sp. CCI2.3]MEB0022165.1 hypothetical protein [Actimicrobium sp. CCI2.3]
MAPYDCTAEMVEPTGPDTMVFAWFNQTRATCRTHPRAGGVPGGEITLAFDLSKAVLFDPVREERIA